MWRTPTRCDLATGARLQVGYIMHLPVWEREVLTGEIACQAASYPGR